MKMLFVVVHVPPVTVTVPLLPPSPPTSESLPVTRPPLTLSLPVPLEPTVRLLVVAQVPLDTLTVPKLAGLEPSLDDDPLTMPPATLSVPVPVPPNPNPTFRLPLVAKVPLDTVTVLTPPAP